ncbi:MAG: hypothetical protein HC902_02650 [Calothrix sp. SM1_5_4]|nr:hypothetical protein [Calothrix sp. SM1_5_4]
MQAEANKIGAETGQAGNAAADALQTQSASGSQGSSNDSLLSGLMGAAAGGLLGYMLGKSSSDDDSSAESDAYSDTSALATGTLNCAAVDGYRYSDCDSGYASSCYGAFSSSDACSGFTARYCSSSTSSGATVAVSGTTNCYTVDATGAGIGSSYCQYYLASAYCSVSGRGACPSCLLLSNFTSESCQNSPALCIAQNSAEQIESAKSTCPTDPVFSNPSFSGYVSGVTAGTSSTVAVTLPQSVSPGPASDIAGPGSASLFSISSRAIASRCATGKLKCR